MNFVYHPRERNKEIYRLAKGREIWNLSIHCRKKKVSISCKKKKRKKNAKLTVELLLKNKNLSIHIRKKKKMEISSSSCMEKTEFHQSVMSTNSEALCVANCVKKNCKNHWSVEGKYRKISQLVTGIYCKIHQLLGKIWQILLIKGNSKLNLFKVYFLNRRECSFFYNNVSFFI